MLYDKNVGTTLYIQPVSCCDSSVLFAVATAGDGSSTTNAAISTGSLTTC